MTTVDSGDTYPLTMQKGFLIRPGHQNYVVLDAVRVSADVEIKAVKPKSRNCYFDAFAASNLIASAQRRVGAARRRNIGGQVC